MRTNLENANIATLNPSGYISAANAHQFQEDIHQAIASKADDVLLVNMEQVEFMDSAGLMALVSGFRLAKTLGRRLIICSIAPSVRMIFELTQLDRVFDIFDTRQEFELSLCHAITQ